MSRFNDKRSGAMVIIMQRLHLDDVVGHVQEHGDWEVVSLPAIAEIDEVHTFETLTGPQTITRRTGEALHPERESVELLEGLRRTMGEYDFSGQYQQAPVPQGGGMVKRDWLHFYEAHELPVKFDQIVQSWDTANKETELADYSVCTTWGITKTHRFLLDVRRERLNYPNLKRAVADQIERFRPQVVLIEDKASGTQLIQELRQSRVSIVKKIKPKGHKTMRMHAQTAAFEGGFVKLPRRAAWLDAYVLELTTFPRARHDDQVDSTAQALAWIVEFGSEPGILTYLREEFERGQRGG
jgi:predicted phage terminase large subunit-like protein